MVAADGPAAGGIFRGVDRSGNPIGEFNQTVDNTLPSYTLHKERDRRGMTYQVRERHHLRTAIYGVY